MRIILSLLIIIFSLQSFTKADDIRDFEIEGITIGDSLLFHLEKDKIEKINSENKKIKYARALIEENLKTYDYIQVWFLDNDKNFIISALAGEIDFPNNINECKIKQTQIVEEIKLIFSDLKYHEDETKNMHDKTGKSITFHKFFEFKNGDFINIQCYQYSKEYNSIDHLKVVIGTKVFDDHYAEVKNSN